MNPNGYSAQKEGARPPTYGTFGGRASAVRPGSVRQGASRILGDQRRETAEAAAAAARAARRRLARGEDDDVGDGGLDDDESGLFADAAYDDEDREADAIYASVDRRVEAGRAAQRETRVAAELKRYREENPTIGQQFAGPKAGLAAVSYDEWAAVPDIGDYSVKKQKLEKYTPAPDSLLEQARKETAVAAAAPALAGTATDLAVIGAGRTSVLGQNLDRAGGTVSGRATVDPAGYLTEMAGVHINSESEISDIKKARLLLNSVTTTNPKHAPGWIAAARLEEVAGKMSIARSLAAEGCRRCPKEEDVWLEAARLYPLDRAKRVLAQAVIHVPKSVKVWLQASALETEVKRKRRVLRKALEVIPRSARLWRAAVELEDAGGARILLSRAVECVPDDAELWLALAKLEPYERARAVLSRARAALPTEPAVWVTAARLEETTHGPESASIANLLRKAVSSLSEAADVVDRDRWLSEAREADRAGFPGTCDAIVSAAIALGVEEADRRDVWLEDAAAAERAGALVLARAIFAQLTKRYPASEDLWRSSAEFEQRCGDRGRVRDVLARAVEYCATAEVLWLMLAKEEWRAGSVDAARQRLDHGLQANPGSEAIWLAAAKVETEHEEFERAQLLLQKARLQAPSARVFMKSALLERQLRNDEAELSFLDEGVTEYPKAEKLWLMLAQWHERNKRPLVERVVENDNGDANAKPARRKDGRLPSLFRDALAVYKEAVGVCPYCAPLWIHYARLVERGGSAAATRAVLERARQANKGREDVDLLWRESVYLEVRLEGGAGADALLARALRECPTSGRVWALAMAVAPKAARKARTGDALRECGRDAGVILEAGKLLWRDHKIAKARNWLLRSVELNPDNGDAWGALHAFEQLHGDEDKVAEVEKRVEKAEPCHGDVWTAVRKWVGNERLSRIEVLREVARVSTHTTCTTGLFYVGKGADDIPNTLDFGSADFCTVPDGSISNSYSSKN